MNGSAWRSAQFLFARHVLRRTRLVARARYFDLRVHCFSDDVIGRHLYKRGAIERRMTETLIDRLVLPVGSVSFDVGANLGWYSLILDRLAQPGARVFAFEPDPDNFRLLLANVEANGARTVSPQQMAVSDRAGTETLHRYAGKNRGRHSLLPGAGTDPIEVLVTALDTFRAAQAPRAPVAFVKVDVEGYELPVLAGLSGALAARAVDCVQFEYGGTRLDARRRLQDACKLFEANGYAVHRLLADGVARFTYDSTRDEHYKYANFVATHDPGLLHRWGVPRA